MIEIKNLSKTYSNTPILENINVTINKGDVIAIIGPSGMGKSTFLNCINLLEKATSGQIIFEGVDLMDKKIEIEQYRKKIGMVFQSFNLFANMTIIENAMIPQMDLLKTSKQDAYDNAMKQLTLVGMAEKAFQYPNELSGGQRQRAAIARTLSMNPEVILFDEPTSALDPTMVGEVEYVIKKLAQQGHTMLIVTHEMRFAREVSNRIFYMDEKGIYEEGPTEKIFTNPDKDKTRRFINRIKNLEIVIDSADFNYIDVIEKIEQYGDKIAISHSKINKCCLLFEEFCVQNLLPLEGDNPNIKAVFEYNEENESVLLNVYHRGEHILPNIPELSKKIIEGVSKEISLVEICE